MRTRRRELESELPCVNTLVKHVSRFRGKMLRPCLVLLTGKACGELVEAHNGQVEAMAHRLATPEGKKLYRLRKQMPEPVFGIIKSVLGFRQFLLRGLDKVRGEWSLVTMAWNLKRMFTLCSAH